MSIKDQEMFEDYFNASGVLLEGVLDLGFTAIIEPLSVSDQLSLIAATSRLQEQEVNQVDFDAATQVCSQPNTLPDLELPLIAAPAKGSSGDHLD